jgi:hypothetical protein
MDGNGPTSAATATATATTSAAKAHPRGPIDLASCRVTPDALLALCAGANVSSVARPRGDDAVT